MMRSPRVASVCLSFPDIPLLYVRFRCLAGAALDFGLGMALSLGGVSAQTPAKGSSDHIKAVTSAVDGAMIRTNTATSNDWPTIGLDYAETRFSKLHEITADNVKRL